MSFVPDISPTVTKLDIAIIGGGSAGITLAAKLKDVSAVVVEPHTPNERNCSWAFWADSSQKKQLEIKSQISTQNKQLLSAKTKQLAISSQNVQLAAKTNN